jgi:hypothetical protein
MTSSADTIFDPALKKYKPPIEPRYVFLFSGHMIDAPGRKEARFPPGKEAKAAEAIAKKLDELGAGRKDLALCGGACGGDTLFAEACIKLGLCLEIRIPFDESTFLKNSVTFAGESWRDRYYAVKNNRLTTLFMMPEELGPTPADANPYERNNLWMLYTALSMGSEKVRFICLWDGKGGDGPGGTKHMHGEVLNRSGQVYVIDTNKL